MDLMQKIYRIRRDFKRSDDVALSEELRLQKLVDDHTGLAFQEVLGNYVSFDQTKDHQWSDKEPFDENVFCEGKHSAYHDMINYFTISSIYGAYTLSSQEMNDRLVLRVIDYDEPAVIFAPQQVFVNTGKFTRVEKALVRNGLEDTWYIDVIHKTTLDETLSKKVQRYKHDRIQEKEKRQLSRTSSVFGGRGAYLMKDFPFVLVDRLLSDLSGVVYKEK